ncbi:LysR family transcriptional regulator [Nocardioidaceae bacterium SCSIO 66511]|nr:LysR family transcriptional regulator [Nocardioidaceae bacterium SCSIO 66511]
MQIQQLSYFVTVARVRNFTRAADAMGVAQPTLSKQIRVLENSLGSALFVRDRGGVSLTAAGEALLPHARRIVIDVENAQRAVQEVAGMQRGRIRLGATPSLCDGLLADALHRFRNRYPGIDVAVEEGGSRDLTRSLGRGQLDLALVIVPLTDDERDLETTPILRESLVLASPAEQHDLPARMAVGQLRDRPMVMFRDGYDLRETTLNACHAAGFEPTFSVEGGEMNAVLRFVEAGLGVAVVPSMVLGTRPKLRATLLERPRLERTIALAHRRADILPQTAIAFKRDLIEHLAALGPDDLGEDLELLPVP